MKILQVAIRAVLASQVMALALVDAWGETPKADVVVYGDASGGVVAAVQAARMGKSAILVSQYGHLGGLTSSGLGWSDIGNDKILGGLSREFYHQLYLHYQKPEAWVQQKREEFGNKGQGVPGLNEKTELASVFEPKVAEAVFDAMVKEAGVRVVKGRLDLEKGVMKDGTTITGIRLEDGTVIEGKVFIDASYEGDLMPLAGVSFVTGRESNSEFDEQGNGNTGVAKKNQLPNGIDPYVVAGDASSGLLPGVNPDLGGEKGEGDHRLQAYCYRMVLTDVPENRIMIEKPDGYDEADYEILFRAMEAGQKGGFFKLSPMPNRKTDSNNNGGISTDYIGMNYGPDWDWSTLDHEEREKLAAKHRDWQLGLVWSVQNHPRVPEPIRKAYAPWGLPKDEFTDNGHWPYNLYVREARRMRSDFVMTENHCKRTLPVEDPVGMGAYTLDSHNTQRVVHNGMVKNEGDIQSYLGGKAYGISYRSLVPKAEECTNLLVPWALSATHIAFGSIRMEPVFMILSQSAATAACMAIDAEIPVQDVPYDKLRARLVADGQALGVLPME
ncbi:FAD-dependent oxidoreductase [Haloferula sp. A504]|uniref:FAD-dependent oxidoreductase n=1 Tax=Haloferula sp. A504 TaxID=3373601 RepID=UPI0031C5CC1C|nr:FAD-dependent oxidoreductase [Verrucomicrobiaceae bacterium E54]